MRVSGNYRSFSWGSILVYNEDCGIWGLKWDPLGIKGEWKRTWQLLYY